jgi:hypothetical protein
VPRSLGDGKHRPVAMQPQCRDRLMKVWTRTTGAPPRRAEDARERVESSQLPARQQTEMGSLEAWFGLSLITCRIYPTHGLVAFPGDPGPTVVGINSLVCDAKMITNEIAFPPAANYDFGDCTMIIQSAEGCPREGCPTKPTGQQATCTTSNKHNKQQA